MPPTAASIFLTVLFALDAFAQITLGPPAGPITIGRLSRPPQTPASPGWPFGQPHTRLTMEGLLICSDGDKLSLELPDQRVIRLQLDDKTRYFPEGQPESLACFHMTDFVQVEAEVSSKDLLTAQSVRFIRKASPDEQAEVFQSPELLQRWRANVLASRELDPSVDDRKLSLVSKPAAMLDDLQPNEHLRANPRQTAGPSRVTEDDLIARARRSVNEAFQRLPNFRAKQITSMFGSSSKPVKWIPDGVVTLEVAYEEERESYSGIRVDGKQLADAPATADAAYMHSSWNKAWSTGDFKTLSHCVFSELADADFRKTGTEKSNGETLVVYEFSGKRSSGCIGVTFKSQITYPAYKGSMKVRAKTGEVLHVELSASEIPSAFPLDRAERSVDFRTVQIGGAEYLLPTTAYWFGCFRNSYACFLNRIDFRDYRRFEVDSSVMFGN